MGRGYKDLIVWQKAKDFCVDIYKLTNEFPETERFGLVSQLEISKTLFPALKNQIEILENDLLEIMKMLNKLRTMDYKL